MFRSSNTQTISLIFLLSVKIELDEIQTPLHRRRCTSICSPSIFTIAKFILLHFKSIDGTLRVLSFSYVQPKFMGECVI